MSVARSLGLAGVRVYAIGARGSAIVQYSRFCSGFADLGAGKASHERWLEWLVSGPSGAVLLPCDDDALDFIATHRQALLDMGHVPMEANDQALAAVLDKAKTYALARRIGIPCPRTITFAPGQDIAALVANVAFPCAVKPVNSSAFARTYGRKKAFIVRNERELQAAIACLAAANLQGVVSEVVPGGDDALYAYLAYIDAAGNTVLEAVKRKLRQYPPCFGMGCYHVSQWDPDVAALGRRFFREAEIRGLAYVEFKRDARDGMLKLIECNHRFGTGMEVFRAAGVDLALASYDHLVGRPLRTGQRCRDGVRLWHPIDDFRAFLAYRSAGTLTFGKWLRSLMHPVHVPVFSWTDPGPSLSDLRRRGARVLRELAIRQTTGGAHRTFVDNEALLQAQAAGAAPIVL